MIFRLLLYHLSVRHRIYFYHLTFYFLKLLSRNRLSSR